MYMTDRAEQRSPVDMPVFHFNIRRDNVVYEDRQGTFLATIADAVLHAAHDARHIMRTEPEVSVSGQWVEVVDEVGNAVRTVPFVTVQRSN
jgi:hypothetical protein